MTATPHPSILQIKGLRLIVGCLVFIGLTSAVNGAVNDSITYTVQQTTTSSEGTIAPFWFHNQHFGTMPSQPFSSLLRTSITSRMLIGPKLHLNYGLDAALTTASGNSTRAWIHQLYLHTRWLIFDLTIGSQENQQLLTDRLLSSGALIFSPNSRPMPRITAGIEQFTSVPFTHNQIQFRGGITHAWFIDNTYVPDVWMHHKYFHLRLGNQLPVRLQIGLDHMAQWGGQLPGQPVQLFNLTNFKTIFLARSGGEGSTVFEQNNAIGNHILSEHAKLELETGKYTTTIYWQNIVEDGPFRFAPWKMMNREDGLWGVSIENKSFPILQKIVAERINTTDQSGYIHDKDGIIYGGQDSYFTNGTYLNDWAFFRRSIGNPLILSPVYNTDGSYRINHIWIKAYHLGMAGQTGEWKYRFMGTHVNHYNFYLQPFSTNRYWMVELSRTIHSVELELKIGSDTGTFPGNTTGVQFTFKKSGILFRP